MDEVKFTKITEGPSKGGVNPGPTTPRPVFQPPGQGIKKVSCVQVPHEDYQSLVRSLVLTEQRNQELEKLLDAIPQCLPHGRCIPHALGWIKEAKEKLKNA